MLGISFLALEALWYHAHAEMNAEWGRHVASVLVISGLVTHGLTTIAPLATKH